MCISRQKGRKSRQFTIHYLFRKRPEDIQNFTYQSEFSYLLRLLYCKNVLLWWEHQNVYTMRKGIIVTFQNNIESNVLLAWQCNVKIWRLISRLAYMELIFYDVKENNRFQKYKTHSQFQEGPCISKLETWIWKQTI